MISSSIFFGTALTLASYMIGVTVKNRFKREIFNPILISIIIIIAVLLLFDIDYDKYNASASYISYFLTPTTICLAVPLYRQLCVLRKNPVAIICGILSGVATSCIATYLLSVAFSLTNTQYYTLLPKSITTAIGLPLSQEIGGIADITVTVIILTGIFGNLIASFVIKIFRIKNPISKGIAIGTSSHAIGTAKAIEMGEVETAMSSLSIAISGIITVIVIQFLI